MLAGLTPDEYKRLHISVGIHRRKRALSPLEVAALLAKATSAGATPSDCAAALDLKGPTWVARFLSLLKLPSDVHHLIDWGHNPGTVTLTAATEIARLRAPDDQRQGVKAMLEHTFSSAEVRQLVQLRLRADEPIAECVRATLRMRPHIETHHVYIGAVTSPENRSRLEALSQNDRDQLLKAACKTTFPEIRIGGRLGVYRFTLVGGKDFGKQVAARKDSLQQDINDAIARGFPSHDLSSRH